ncbi:1-acyl-sn-glycerol-3-phosphate acyltransferase alpha [Patella vulgata]|uniref:1-acyl-sn-glycerol-3-phosphate acyltransferase alpha n=1 Tax=Patella vulgata TaxID=6465 RepID=UPI00217FE74A|nr:1-acyl-sn-glycerol-3-phosphate acyltransferase alpha [Patella vulgata]
MAIDIFQWIIIGLLLLLPILYELSTSFKYYAKFFFFYAIINVISLLVVIVGIWRPKDVNNIWIVIASMKVVKKLFGIEVEVRGQEHLQSNEPFILVSNHQSSLDFFGMMTIWPDRCTSLAKKELIYAIFFGIAAWLCGTIFIDRLNHDKALDTLKNTAELIKKENLKVYVFPEGTRNCESGMLPFKKGAFNLAVQAQVPVVPVVFSTYSDFYCKRDHRFESGKLVIQCLPKVPTEGLGQADVGELTESIRKDMLDVFNQISLEMRQPKLVNGLK